MKTPVRLFVLATLLSCSFLVFSAEMAVATGEVKTTDVVIPDRPVPVIEIGDSFLGTGTLYEGFEIFTGAIWQPSLVVFGTYRSALQTQDNGINTTTEWVNRLDLFANLYLSRTERFLIAVRPLDENGVFSGYRFEPNEANTNALNFDFTTFFFEGDFGELFPKIDEWDRDGYDMGFSIGRQSISFQEGIMINDTFDVFGMTQNSLSSAGTSNIRITGLYGWNELNRSNNVLSNSTSMYGLFTEIDFFSTTVAIDFAFVNDVVGDAYFIGLSAVQRLGHLNTAFRLLTSNADNNSAFAGTGVLLFVETSFAPQGTDDSLYVNGFIAVDQYSSVARASDVGGPLGRTGILFAASAIGTTGVALSNQASDVFGGAIGYQTFFGPIYTNRKQLIIEAGFRQDSNNVGAAEIAIGARYQQAYGQHYVMILDSYLADYENRSNGYGLRAELLVKF